MTSQIFPDRDGSGGTRRRKIDYRDNREGKRISTFFAYFTSFNYDNLPSYRSLSQQSYFTNKRKQTNNEICNKDGKYEGTIVGAPRSKVIIKSDISSLFLSLFLSSLSLFYSNFQIILYFSFSPSLLSSLIRSVSHSLSSYSFPVRSLRPRLRREYSRMHFTFCFISRLFLFYKIIFVDHDTLHNIQRQLGIDNNFLALEFTQYYMKSRVQLLALVVAQRVGANSKRFSQYPQF